MAIFSASFFIFERISTSRTFTMFHVPCGYHLFFDNWKCDETYREPIFIEFYGKFWAFLKVLKRICWTILSIRPASPLPLWFYYIHDGRAIRHRPIKTFFKGFFSVRVKNVPSLTGKLKAEMIPITPNGL